VKRYEGLFILNAAGKEEALKDTIDKISTEITSAGGKVETVQKMDKKAFSRVADRKHSAGFYVNYVFEGAPEIIAQLRHRFATNEEIFRVLFTVAPAPVVKPEPK
jgi:ribosomal protein S6